MISTTVGPSTVARINIGVYEGYNNNKYSKAFEDYIAHEKTKNDFPFESFLSKKLDEICEEHGFYIPFVVYPTRTIYKKEWGCPESSGEKTYFIEATRNMQFDIDDEKWRANVVTVIKVLKTTLHQATVTIQFINSDVIYLK